MAAHRSVFSQPLIYVNKVVVEWGHDHCWHRLGHSCTTMEAHGLQHVLAGI